jgi:hypothetical protein
MLPSFLIFHKLGIFSLSLESMYVFMSAYVCVSLCMFLYMVSVFWSFING